MREMARVRTQKGKEEEDAGREEGKVRKEQESSKYLTNLLCTLPSPPPPVAVSCSCLLSLIFGINIVEVVKLNGLAGFFYISR